MSQKSSNSIKHVVHRSGAMARPVKKSHDHDHHKQYKWSRLFIFPVWVLASFFGAQIVLIGLLWFIQFIGINLGAYTNGATLETVFAALIYLLAFAIAFGVPYLIGRRRVDLKTLGLTRLMSWTDIGLAPIGFIVYLIITAILLITAIRFIPGFPADQAQDIGFRGLTNQMGYFLAFTTLVIVAPIAEETLFRGYLYGKLRGSVPIWVAMIATSIVFGAVHGQWNVALDTFALSMVMCCLREITGSIWAGILLHMIKNTIAFYLLFISPLVSPTLGG
jgi:membrane protease YdiL (CAAX protease family)